MEWDEDQSIDIETESWDISSEGELGALLRSQREKFGLTLDQLSERIRVRTRFLEALENEAWDGLPSPGFVRGFIRNYARAVGLDPDTVLTLYETTNVSQEAGFEPHQAMSSAKSQKPVLLLITLLVILLVAGVGFYYAWQLYGHRPADSIPTPNETPGSNKKADTLEIDEVIVDKQADKEALPEAKTETLAELTPESVPTPTGTSSADTDQVMTTADKSPEKADASKVSVTPIETAGKDPALEEATEKTATRDTSGGPHHTLRAIVKERTWIRIFVDDQNPKEFVFQPGSQPQWEAFEGFELLIGNAGGIDLDFNGEQMTDLGASGKVIRVFLPEEFKQNRKED